MSMKKPNIIRLMVVTAIIAVIWIFYPRAPLDLSKISLQNNPWGITEQSSLGSLFDMFPEPFSMVDFGTQTENGWIERFSVIYKGKVCLITVEVDNRDKEVELLSLKVEESDVSKYSLYRDWLDRNWF